MGAIKHEEPKLDIVLSLLKDKSGVEQIKCDAVKISNCLYFFEAEQLPSLFYEVEKFDDDEYDVYLKNIMKLYPISEPVIERMIEQIDMDSNSARGINIHKSYGIANAQSRNRENFLWKVVNNSNISKEIDLAKKDIAALTTEKDRLSTRFKELEETGTQEKELKAEVDTLAKRVKDLEKSYTKEALEQQQTELLSLEKQLNKSKDQYEKDKKYLASMSEELRQISSGNDAYKKALSAANAFAKLLPAGEE